MNDECKIEAIQTLLGVDADGTWGPKSQFALDALTKKEPVPVASKIAFEQLKPEYNRLFASIVIKSEHIGEVERFAAKVQAGFNRYTKVENVTKVPWYVIGLIHGLEGDFSFDTHLHNGDSLKRRTIHEPAGRPVKGQPPFEWEVSAADALVYDNLTSWSDWSVAGICYKLEGYNGWGYRKYHPDVLTPYLWSFSNHYTKGKYGADGQWNNNLVSAQCGAAVALRKMLELKVFAET